MTRAPFGLRGFGCLLALLVASSASACGSSKSGFDDVSTPPTGFDAPVLPDAGPTPKTGCSADLRSVIREDGSVIKECPVDQGCLAAECVPACQAAASAKGTLGCDFYAPTPFVWYPPSSSGRTEVSTQSCYVAMIVNGWATDMKIGVQREGKSYDVTSFARIPNGESDPLLWRRVPAQGLGPNEVAVLFLSEDPVVPPNPEAFHVSCPLAPAIEAPTALHSVAAAVTGRGRAFHIVTDMPANAYDIYPFGGAPSFAPSASLLLPTSAWSTSYLASAVNVGTIGLGTRGGLNNSLQVVAQQDGTKVTILPTAPLPSGSGVAPTDRFQPATYTLDAGEYIQWADLGAVGGSILASDKPVGVVTGNGALTIGDGDADGAHQQLFPVGSLGTRYVAVPIARGSSKNRGQHIVITAAVDGTKVHVEPETGVTIDLTLNAGESKRLPESTFSGGDAGYLSAVTVSTQDRSHPIQVAQQMPGCDVASPDCGGPDHVHLVPTEQHLNKYVFYTDLSYSTTTLAITRSKVGGSFKDVVVDCHGKVDGWRTAPGGEQEVAVIDLRLRGSNVGSCADGAHTATSAGPFGVVVWGLSKAASYGYPAGGSVARINDLDLKAVVR